GLDFVEAFVWLSRAAEQGLHDAARMRDLAAGKMSLVDISEAKRRASSGTAGDYIITHTESRAWGVVMTPEAQFVGLWISEEYLPASRVVDQVTLRALLIDTKGVGPEYESAL